MRAQGATAPRGAEADAADDSRPGSSSFPSHDVGEAREGPRLLVERAAGDAGVAEDRIEAVEEARVRRAQRDLPVRRETPRGTQVTFDAADRLAREELVRVPARQHVEVAPAHP